MTPGPSAGRSGRGRACGDGGRTWGKPGDCPEFPWSRPVRRISGISPRARRARWEWRARLQAEPVETCPRDEKARALAAFGRRRKRLVAHVEDNSRTNTEQGRTTPILRRI